MASFSQSTLYLIFLLMVVTVGSSIACSHNRYPTSHRPTRSINKCSGQSDESIITRDCCVGTWCKWCARSPGASNQQLQESIEFACGRVECGSTSTQRGGSCYEPNTISSQDTYGMNLYYQNFASITSCHCHESEKRNGFQTGKAQSCLSF